MADQAMADAATDDMALEDMAAMDAMVPDAEPLPACSDGEDNDLDEVVDYPLDPGCTHPEDDDETDPETSECADGQDNDGNGLIDHPDDPGCAAQSDPREHSVCDPDHTLIDLSGRSSYEGTTEGMPTSFEVCRNNRAPEAAFLFTLRDEVAQLRFDTEGSSFDTLLGVYLACDDLDSEIACNDDYRAGSTASKVIIQRPHPGTTTSSWTVTRKMPAHSYSIFMAI